MSLPTYYIGLMSGTSLDGADGVLVRFSDQSTQVLAHASLAFEADFRAELLALNTAAYNDLHLGALAANQIALHYAQLVQQLMRQCSALAVAPQSIRAVGAHGQTVRHHPQGDARQRYTLQLINPALLAELCGLDVVADFRSRDVAAGGQGAPLVPAFHQAVFSDSAQTVCVLNIGGIANLTVLASDHKPTLLGFDCGPGNVLMDAWCQAQTGHTYDAEGAWAARGQVIPSLLEAMLREPYFEQHAPKSTGRDLFSMQWLERHLTPYAAYVAEDIQATLTELTAQSSADCVRTAAPQCNSLIVCGGGAFNTHLMHRLSQSLPSVRITRSDAHGLPAQQVEAAAFAWLARQTIERRTGSVASVTGAQGARILGAVYPA